MSVSLEVSAKDVAFVLYSILYGNSEGFEDVLENGFNEIELFADALYESEKKFVINKNLTNI